MTQASTSLAPTRSAAARKARPFVVFGVAAAVILLGILLLPFLTAENTRALSTESTEPDGARAIAQLLDDQGVDVTEETSPRDAVDRATADTTLVVADTNFLTKPAARAIKRSQADVVLLQPLPVRLADVTGDVQTAGAGGTTEVAPDCPLAAAQRAGTVDIGNSDVYDVAPGAEAMTCYPAEDGAHLVQLRDGSRTITVVSSSYPFQNGGLTSAGNAAFAMNLLGANEDLIWLLPNPQSSDFEPTGSLTSLLPDVTRIAAFGTIVAILLYALARGRRLGPVVSERLPVLVRATETTEGRARLYRTLRARERAADSLRRGTIAKIRAPLRLPRDSSPDAVVAAVAARVQRNPAEVGSLLYGGAPPDDAALVRLADDLDTLEGEVRRS